MGYKDFFEYASTFLSGNLVLFANGDIVFDESLRRIVPERIMSGEIGLLLSVKPPPDNGRYKEIFGTECHPTLRCAVGSWQGGAGFSAGPSGIILASISTPSIGTARVGKCTARTMTSAWTSGRI